MKWSSQSPNLNLPKMLQKKSEPKFHHSDVTFLMAIGAAKGSKVWEVFINIIYNTI